MMVPCPLRATNEEVSEGAGGEDKSGKRNSSIASEPEDRDETTFRLPLRVRMVLTQHSRQPLPAQYHPSLLYEKVQSSIPLPSLRQATLPRPALQATT